MASSHVCLGLSGSNQTMTSVASVIRASGIGQLQAISHVAGPRLSHGKTTRKAVATMGFNDLVARKYHMLGPSCQRYNLQAGR